MAHRDRDAERSVAVGRWRAGKAPVVLLALVGLVFTALVEVAGPAQAQFPTVSPPFTSSSVFASGWSTCGGSGIGPLGLMFDNAGNVFATDCGGTLYRLPSTGGAISSATTNNSGGINGALAFQDGGYYATACHTGCEVDSPAADGLYRFDPTTLAVTATVTTSIGSPRGLVADPASGSLYVASIVSGGSAIYRVDNPASGAASVTAVVTVTGSVFDGLGISSDGSTLYVADPGTGFVRGYSAATGSQVLAVLPFANPPWGVDGIAVAAAGENVGGVNVSNNLFVNTNSGVVLRIDTNNNNAVSLVASGGSRGDYETVGPDRCLYVTQSTEIDKLSPCFFTPATARTLTVAVAGAGSGSVTDNLSMISCPGTCSASYPQDTMVTLTATAHGGSVFSGWSGGGCPGAGTSTCTVTLVASTAITATFSPVQATTTSLMLSTPSVTAGSEGVETFTVSVTGQAGDGYPIGTVTVFSDTTMLCSSPLGPGTGDAASGSCSLSDSEVAAGVYSDIDATFTPAATSSSSPGVGYGASTSSPAQTLTVRNATAEPTSTSLSVSSLSIGFGSEIDETFTVTVSGQTGDGSPIGSVSVADDTTTLCSAPLQPGIGISASAACSLLTATQLGAGTYNVHATFSPAATSSSNPVFQYSASTSAPPQSLVVTGISAPTSTAISLSTSSVVWSDEVLEDFTITVSGDPGDGAPLGLVSVFGNTLLCDAFLQAGADSSTASCTLDPFALDVGSYSHIFAVYTPGGSTNPNVSYLRSTSPTSPTILTVNPFMFQPAPVVTVVPQSLVWGGENGASFTISVSGAFFFPLGTVTLFYGSSPLCTAQLDNPASASDNTATCVLTLQTGLPAGVPLVYATYTPGIPSAPSPNIVYLPSTSPTRVVNVQRALEPVTTVASASVLAVNYGGEQAATFTITVSPAAGGLLATPQGTATMLIARSAADPTGILCAQTLVGGTATCSLMPAELPPGTYTASVSYQPAGALPDPNYSYVFDPSRTSAPLTLVVYPANQPLLTWPPPAAVLYGTALSATQLDAQATVDGQPAAGTFVYDPTRGTVLAPGQHTLRVTFIPADTADLVTVSTSVPFTVEVTGCITSAFQLSTFTVPRGEAICVDQGGAISGRVVLDAGAALFVGGGTIKGAVIDESGATFGIGSGSVVGSLSVARGASAITSGGTIGGPLTATGAAKVLVCGTAINGTIAVTSSPGPVLIGGPRGSGCAGNQIKGSVTIRSNTGGVGFSENTVIGAVTIESNRGGFTDVADSVSGRFIVVGNS